jgi:hypothetical protein
LWERAPWVCPELPFQPLYAIQQVGHKAGQFFDAGLLIIDHSEIAAPPR